MQLGVGASGAAEKAQKKTLRKGKEMGVKLGDVIDRDCPKCGAPCVRRPVRAEWGAGNGVRIDAVSCMRCGEKWLRVSLMDCGEEVLTREVFPEGGDEIIFEKILARAFCADRL